MIYTHTFFEALYPAQYYEKKAQGATTPDEKARYMMLSRRAREVRMKKTTRRIDTLKNKMSKPTVPNKPIKPKPLPAPTAQPQQQTVPGGFGNLQISRQ